MNIADKNIILVAEDQKLKNKITNGEFAASIGIDQSNLTKIKKSDSKDRSYHFTPEQIKKVGEKYSVDMNFIFGFTDKMYRN